MEFAIERSPEMVRLVYFLHEYARLGSDNRALPPTEFGDTTWRSVYEQFFPRMGGGRSFEVFFNSAEGLRKGNIAEHKDAGVAFLPKYEKILSSWITQTREQQWIDLQQFRNV